MKSLKVGDKCYRQLREYQGKLMMERGRYVTLSEVIEDLLSF